MANPFPPTPCQVDFDCALDEFCYFGYCIPSPVYCNQDGSCPAGLVGVPLAGTSLNNCECVWPSPSQHGCVSDYQCGTTDPRVFCFRGACLTSAGTCQTFTDCPPGLDCRGGQCVEPNVGLGGGGVTAAPATLWVALGLLALGAGAVALASVDRG